MKTGLFAATGAVLAGSGCVAAPHGDIGAGDELQAQFVLSWEVQHEMTGERLDCKDIGADTVRVASHDADTNAVLIDLFDCRLGHGSTYKLTAGDYYVDVDLVRCGDDEDCRAPRMVSRSSAVGPYSIWEDGLTDLGHFVFLVR